MDDHVSPDEAGHEDTARVRDTEQDPSRRIEERRQAIRKGREPLVRTEGIGDPDEDEQRFDAG